MLPDALTDDTREVLAVFETSGEVGEPMTTAEVVGRLDLTKERCVHRLEELADRGFLRTKTLETGDRLWWTPPDRTDGTTRKATPPVDSVPGMLYRCRNEPGWPMLFVSDGCRELTGYAPETLVAGRVSFGEEIIHSEDVDDVWDTVQAGIDDDGEFTVQYRIRTSENEIGWVWERGRVVADEAGQPETLEGMITDITELKTQTQHLKEELHEIFERVDDAFYALDSQFQFTYVNEEAERLLQRTEDQLLGETVWEMFPEAAETTAWDQFHEALETQEQTSFELYYDPLDIWVEVNVYPSDSGLSVYFRDITERKERERELQRQREQLAALNDFNRVVRGIADGVIEQSTREEIEQAVCTQLAAAESYTFAWLGDVCPDTDEVQLRAVQGADGLLDEVGLSADPNERAGQGPVGQAVRTGEPQVVQDVLADPEMKEMGWADAVEEYGFRSFAAIPIQYQDTLYGVLGIHSERAGGFAENERRIVGQLGEIVGHAINAYERKQALMSDEVTEVDFVAHDVFEDVIGASPAEGTIVFERAIPIGDDRFLVYGTATADAFDGLRTLAEQVTHFAELTVVTETASEVRYQLRLEEPPIVSSVAAHGGRIQTATLENGNFRLTVELPPGVDVDRIIDIVETTYPTAQIVAQRQTTRTDETPDILRRTLAEELTDRQRAALQAAYYAGYFERPRETTGEEVATSMDLSASTFHQHLRVGQQKLIRTLIAGEKLLR